MKPEGSRSVNRPRQRWLDSVENDLRSLKLEETGIIKRRMAEASCRQGPGSQWAVAPEMMMMMHGQSQYGVHMPAST